VQDTEIVVMEYEIVCGLSNSTNANDLEWPLVNQ